MKFSVLAVIGIAALAWASATPATPANPFNTCCMPCSAATSPVGTCCYACDAYLAHDPPDSQAYSQASGSAEIDPDKAPSVLDHDPSSSGNGDAQQIAHRRTLLDTSPDPDTVPLKDPDTVPTAPNPAFQTPPPDDDSPPPGGASTVFKAPVAGGESDEEEGKGTVELEGPALEMQIIPGELQFGDLTYYGGAGAAGACTQTHVPPGFTTVALNAPQFENGAMCGTCIHACYDDLGLGQGERCFDAIIDNICPECEEGDIDLGEEGDGRWAVEWRTIICPVQELMMSTQGSNIWYGKIKAEGGPSAVNLLQCTDSEGDTFTGELTSDAFWEFNSPGGTFDCGVTCVAGFTCCYSLQYGTVTPEQFGSDGAGC